MLVILSKTGEKAGGRPKNQNGGVKIAHGKAIRREAKDDRPSREGEAEVAFEVSILFLRKAELLRDAGGHVGQRLAIHVVDR